MAAGKRNIVIEKKATFRQVDVLYSGTPTKLNPTAADVAQDVADDVLVPVDLTGATVSAKVKRQASDASPVIAMTAAVTDAAGGEYTLSLTASQTASLAISQGVYDVLVTFPSGEALKVIEGTVRVDATAS
jgi:hypothetical protein